MENVNHNSVVILGYREKFAVNPDISIFKNGMLIGNVAYLGRCQLEIKETCELTFKSAGRSTTCTVHPGDVVLLSINRWTGKIVAQFTDENNQQQLIASNAKKDNKAKVFALIMVILGVSIGVGGYLADSASSSSSSSSSSYPRSGYGSLGYKLAVAQAIEDYSDPYTVSEITKCIEVDANRLEYECTVLCPWAGIEYRGHGHLIQDGMGRNIKGKFYLDR